MKTQYREFVQKSLGLLLVGTISFLLAGCARELPLVHEYKQITKQATGAVLAALNSTEKVSAQTDAVRPKTAAAFYRNLQQLEVDSVKLRARAQAILARGDAYFNSWSESMAAIKNAKVRQLAESHHEEIKQTFSRIKLTTQQAGAAFQPFLASLRKLRVQLENRPEEIKAGSANELIHNTREQGRQVLDKLGAINSELEAMVAMLTPSKSNRP
jgi:hypothetical protein